MTERKPSRIVGILGGMGPAATVDFYRKMIAATGANVDQDHIRTVIWADPTVPNRHEALMNGGTDPTPWLEAGVRNLMRCGAEILVAPCNTVHAFLPSVIEGKDLEFISIIGVTVDAVRRIHRDGKVGLLAADGTLAAGLYQSALQHVGIDTIVPSPKSQRALMQLIYAVKAGRLGTRDRRRLLALLDELRERDASIVVAGCTEVSVLIEHLDTDVVIIDSSWELATNVVQRAWN